MMIYVIFGLIALASYLVQRSLNSKSQRYSKVSLPWGLTGADVARKMLNENGLGHVSVTQIDGHLTDHYNPSDHTVNLSRDVYYGHDVAAAAVAAHECGHAVQHARAYAPLRMRSALVPPVSFASKVMPWVLLAGILMIQTFPMLMLIGILLFALTTLFSFVTLPVEIDASRRALAWLGNANITTAETAPMAMDALKSAAYTYVVAALGSLATLIYYILVFTSRRD
ncbi:MAG: zinc metallopeptidase [Pseudoflavonifractor sp.]|nr:zinc metallopeptidase [Pseudoflavonifractor sp.]